MNAQTVFSSVFTLPAFSLSQVRAQSNGPKHFGPVRFARNNAEFARRGRRLSAAALHWRSSRAALCAPMICVKTMMIDKRGAPRLPQTPRRTPKGPQRRPKSTHRRATRQPRRKRVARLAGWPS